ncbi:unnamed protein product [Mesocestoides corti]|uniref:Nuclear receptor domain-containing protein n=1 Tax=Mesocestoides corti TaxID=53468 RepID=A0A0R3URD6_MESCO|nr:unnamed protein product [Mesocestoides corti]
MDPTKRPKPRVVCGDDAMGFHYHTMSCDDCKRFFCHSMQGKVGSTCQFYGQCHVADNKNRTRRKKCRLDRCLKIGVTKERKLPEQYFTPFLYFGGISGANEANEPNDTSNAKKSRYFDHIGMAGEIAISYCVVSVSNNSIQMLEKCSLKVRMVLTDVPMFVFSSIRRIRCNFFKPPSQIF